MQSGKETLLSHMLCDAYLRFGEDAGASSANCESIGLALTAFVWYWTSFVQLWFHWNTHLSVKVLFCVPICIVLISMSQMLKKSLNGALAQNHVRNLTNAVRSLHCIATYGQH